MDPNTVIRKVLAIIEELTGADVECATSDTLLTELGVDVECDDGEELLDILEEAFETEINDQPLTARSTVGQMVDLIIMSDA